MLAIFSKMMAQTHTLASSSPIITSFTTQSACTNRPQSERSWAKPPKEVAATSRSIGTLLLGPGRRRRDRLSGAAAHRRAPGFGYAAGAEVGPGEAGQLHPHPGQVRA